MQALKILAFLTASKTWAEIPQSPITEDPLCLPLFNLIETVILSVPVLIKGKSGPKQYALVRGYCH